MNSQASTTDFQPGLRLLGGILILIWAILFSIALSGYPDLKNNEERVGGYVLDAVNNGNWMIQKDLTGDMASKPPMLTWLIGLTSLASGGLSRFSTYFPTALATLAISLVILAAVSKRMGRLAGFLGALCYLLSIPADFQMTTARYDGLFALPVLLAGLAAHRAWALGRGWTWFWLAAAAATLVKGPLGLLLGGAGLVAVFWEWKSGEPRRPRGNHLAGIALYLLICGGWFGLAYLQAGQAVIDKMIFRELVGHSIASKEGGGDIEFYKPVFYLLSKFLPWSLLSAMAFWRIWKAPSGDADLRRFERFLVCWIIVGLVVFSLSSHQRTRLILPIVPPMAILAGHELARRISGWRPGAIRNSLAALTVVLLACFALQRHVLMARERNVQETLSVYEMADSIKARVGAAFPLTYLHNSVAMQFCMDSYKPFVSDDDAAKLLRGDAAAFVLVQDMDSLRGALGLDAPPLHELMTRKISRGRSLTIVSNHPKLEWAGSIEGLFGPLRVRMEGAKLLRQRGNRFEFERPAAASLIRVSNKSTSPQHVEITLRGPEGSAFHEKQLTPGESWQL